MDDYSQMLLAAGWIKAEDLDEEYQEYRRRQYMLDQPMTYEEWKHNLNRLDDLNSQYKAEIQPLYDADPSGNIGYFAREREKQLLKSMGDIEMLLGY